VTAVAALAPGEAAALLAALEWQVELGADEAIAEAPVDRFAAEAESTLARAAAGAASSAPRAFAAPAAPAVAAPAAAGDAAETAEAIAAACGDLAALRAALDAFEGCSFKRGARTLVFADGDPRARVMIVGEAPGREEDMAGLPFVGRSGRLLDRMLAAIGLSRSAPDPAGGVYITNVLPWRPPANRDPSSGEAAILRPFLMRHIALADPEALVLMGSAALRAVTGGAGGVGRMRGRWLDIGGRAALPMFHPAALLREPIRKREAWADLLTLRARLDASGEGRDGKGARRDR